MASPGSSASAPSDRAALAEQNEDGLLASSFFPAPPTIYKSFTLRHLELARLVVDAQPRRDEPWAQANQDAILETLSCEERPDIDLRELVEPPNVEWIQEQGGYDAFASEWPLDEHLPTLVEMGVQQLYPSGQDRRESLRRLLNTVLVTFVRLVDAMLKPPPALTYEAMKDFDPNNPRPTETQQLIQHIRIACINMHHLCNELRPVQARESLQAMMRQQIDHRKARTQQLRKSCAHISGIIADLRAKYDSTESMNVDAPSADADRPLPQVSEQREDEADDWHRVVAAVNALS